MEDDNFPSTSVLKILQLLFCFDDFIVIDFENGCERVISPRKFHPLSNCLRTFLLSSIPTLQSTEFAPKFDVSWSLSYALVAEFFLQSFTLAVLELFLCRVLWLMPCIADEDSLILNVMGDGVSGPRVIIREGRSWREIILSGRFGATLSTLIYVHVVYSTLKQCEMYYKSSSPSLANHQIW
jgi:hypothetical protein